MMDRHANFCLVQFPEHDVGDAVVIKDMGPWHIYPTVTNDAEEVVEKLFAHKVLKIGQRLFYYDSDNRLNEIIIEGDRFTGFVPGPRR